MKNTLVLRSLQLRTLTIAMRSLHLAVRSLQLRTILLLIVVSTSIQAQQWHYYNPTFWYDINTVEILGPGVIAIGGGWETNDSTQIMFQTSDYGESWYENAHDGLAPWNKSIAFSDAMNGYGVGYDGRIIKTDDAGINWGWPVTPTNSDLNKIIYVGAGTYYAAGGNKTNDSIQTILKSINYGNTWSVIFDAFGPWLKSIYFIDTLKGFAVGDNGVILATTNGGNTWTSITAPIQRDFNAITFINADTGYIVGGAPSGLCRRTILQTVNGGTNWTVLSDTIGGILKDISFADSLVGYTVGDSATVLKTTDGGFNWLPITIDTNLTGNETFNAVKFYDRNFGAIGGKSGVFYVFQYHNVEVFTLGLTQIGTTDATLLGGINTHDKNAIYSFVYANNVLFSAPFSTPPVNIQNDSLILITEYIQGLTPNTTYYYYLKATTLTDTIYGDTLCLYTGTTPPFYFQTTDATNVSIWGANLNGFICNFPEPVNLFFEYGTSPAFGTQVAAILASVNDTMMHNIQTNITNLLANKQYFYRLKGVSASGIYYGDTKTFYSISLPQVNTLSATDITQTSVTLNGNVNNDGFPSAVKFEYGLTTFYGNEIASVPDSVFGTNNVNLISTLTGITTAVTYHFRLKAINSFGTSYGEDRTFILGGPSLSTHPVSNIGLNSAQLNAAVNANNSPTACKFEYGTTTSYGNEANALPDTVTGNYNVIICSQLSGLLQNTIYHYRAKATNAIGTNYGNDLMFTVNLAPLATSLPATDITLNSATLNGTVDAGGIPTSVKFEYGPDTLYGNEIDALPNALSDTGNADVYALLSALIPNSTYHFRIKATNSDTTKFSNDMFFYTGNSEIPNFDFEMWTLQTIVKPESFNMAIGNISKYTPACHNNFAVKIENDTSMQQVPGAILIGTPDEEGHNYIGGVPFNARPDTLIGCFNYFIPANDSAIILLKLKKQGVIISDNYFLIYGSSSGNFIDLKFPILYTDNGDADSIIIGFVSTDFRHMSQPIVSGGYLIVDNIRFTGTTANIPNNDFENWETSTFYSLDNWWYKHTPSFGQPEIHVVLQTTDALHGNFAVLIRNYLLPSDTLSGYLISNNHSSNNCFSVNTRHQSLTGYYKFIPENNDTMSIKVMMFKNNTVIGYGNFLSNSAMTNYLPFVINLQYNDSVVPDSCVIEIHSYSQKVFGNSKLYIDNLNFDGFLSGVKEPPLITSGNFDFNIYPNPFSEQTTVSFTTTKDENVIVRLFDLSGKQVTSLANGKYTSGTHKINLSAQGLQKGFYICIINTEKAVYSKKLIIL